MPTTAPQRTGPLRAPTDHSPETPLIRYPGGTYSSTVERLWFADGTSALTDLIRINPSHRAYSLDFHGVASHLPTPYRRLPAEETEGVAASRPALSWILQHAYPAVGITELSDRLRANGELDGAANLAEHEAIAATQAAIWHHTNGLELDTWPFDRVAPWRTGGEGYAVELPQAPVLSGYEVEVTAARASVVQLEKSEDGRTWTPVASSRRTVESGRTSLRAPLGVGTTVLATRLGGVHEGYRHYRVAIEGDAVVTDLVLVLAGGASRRNHERVVRLYRHLIRGAALADPSSTAGRFLARRHLRSQAAKSGTSQVTIAVPEGGIGTPILLAEPILQSADVRSDHDLRSAGVARSPKAPRLVG